jgi:hypothetical protein
VSVLVGAIPTPEGRAALDAATTETRLRGTTPVVLDASTGDSLVDRRHANTDTMARIEDELARPASRTPSSAAAAGTPSRRSSTWRAGTASSSR